MARSLAGSHAVITGASRGIGRAAALALAEDGAALTLIARSEKELQDVARETRRRGAHTLIAPHDVRDADGIRTTFEEAARYRTPDVLVTSAGINRPGPITDVSLEDLLAILSINVNGTLIPCREFGRQLIAAKHPGCVITVSSQMGAVGYPGRVAYCASKHAVNGLTKALALEWAPHRIRVNAIAPTFISTPLTAPMFTDPGFRADVLSRIPLGRIGEVDDVVGAIRFLASEDAGLITGHVLAIDGGWTAQ